MAPVDWARISPSEFEDIVSVLLSHLNPAATRVDGKGGDGGRDVQIVSPAGIHAYELKSFSGRLAATQRRQVERSLKRAATLDPLSWTLVVAVDHNPIELEWFEKLQTSVGFPISWKGRTWLDSELSQRTHIVRYFLEDAANEVVRLAEALNQESAVLARGAPEALERAGKIAEQLNSLDPFYRYELTVGERVRTVRVIPRYQGAEIDRPIKGTVKFQFPNDESGRAAAEAFERALDFGTAVTVPSEYVEQVKIDAPLSLGGEFAGVELQIAPAHDEAQMTFLFACVSPSDDLLAELPLDLTRTTRGRRGSIWEGSDATQSLRVRLTADTQERKFVANLAISPGPDYYPHQMLPTVRFLAAFAHPNSVEIRDHDGKRLSEVSELPTEPWVEPFMIGLIEDLVLVQTAASMTRRVPHTIERTDLESINVAAALLRGEVISVTWDELVFALGPNPEGSEGHSFSDPEFLITLVTNTPHTTTYAGVEYPLGKRARVEYTARLGGLALRETGEIKIAPVPADWDVIPGGTEIVLIPGSTDQARVSLVAS